MYRLNNWWLDVLEYRRVNNAQLNIYDRTTGSLVPYAAPGTQEYFFVLFAICE